MCPFVAGSVRNRTLALARGRAVGRRGKVGSIERSSGQSQRQFIWHRGDYAALAVCACGGTPSEVGDPILVDESLEQIVPESIQPGDIVGISVHTGNALRGYQVGRMARARGAWVVYGGIHATLFPEEALERGEGHAVVKGDGDVAWGKAVPIAWPASRSGVRGRAD
jgi:hypothetical protein